MPRREYKGAAVPTRLGAGIDAVATSFSINDATGWPTGGANGPFFVTIDPGLSTEERVLVGSRSGTTLSSVTRGVDDTLASSHAAGADGTVIHSDSATDNNEANEHINITTLDHHTQYMKTDGTRHDLTARHSAGTVVPTAAPTTILAQDTSAAEGSGVNLARATHVHGIATGTPSSVGTSLAEGTSTEFARRDHVHTISDAAADALLPTGMIVAYGGGADIGTQWLLCDGRAISRSTFSTLFSVIGVAFGAGDGSTTFNIPDLRQRFPMGKAVSGTGSALGGTGGAIDHVHDLDTSSSHAKFDNIGSGNNTHIDRKTVTQWQANVEWSTAAVVPSTDNVTTGIGLGGNSDTSNPPFQVVNYLIRT